MDSQPKVGTSFLTNGECYQDGSQSVQKTLFTGLVYANMLRLFSEKLCNTAEHFNWSIFIFSNLEIGEKK